MGMPTVRGESKLPTYNGVRCPRMVAIVAINCYPRMAAIVGHWLTAGTNSDPMVILSVLNTVWYTHV